MPFALDDLAEVLVPASPVLFGADVVYVLRRIDRAAKKNLSSLWAVPRAGGEPRRLTQGAWADRAPVADPRGRFVAFVSSRGFGDQLYRLDAGGGEARRLTALPWGAITDPALSPDGRRIALALTPAPPPEDEALPLAADLARAEPDRAPREKPPAPPVDPPPPDPALRPSLPRARVFARLRNREDGVGWLAARSHLWVVDAETGAATRVTDGPRDFTAPAWTPAGDALVAVASRLDDPVDPDLDTGRNDLVRVDLASGRVDALDKPAGAALAPSISPAGDLVAYTHLRPDEPYCNPVVWVSPLAGGAARPLTAALDRPCLDLALDDVAGGVFVSVPPIWSPDGRTVTFVVTDRGAVRLFVQPVDGGPGRYRTDGARAVSSPALAPDGSGAVLVADRGHFTELGRIDGEPAEVTVLTSHNAALAARVVPRTPELVRIEHDGTTIEGYYLPPRGVAPGTRAPAILCIHGGPHVCYGERLFFEMQWLADAGFAVLYGNPRGSQSYGEAHAAAIHFHWGEPDSSDQLAFAEHLASRPEVDPTRIGVGGGSYGGIMTALLCGTTDRFKAGVAQRGLYDWASGVLASDFGHEMVRYFGGVWPWVDPGRYLAESPIRHVDSIRAPLLVIHNEGDLRTGPGQAFELFVALKSRGATTAMVLIPEESHGLSRGGRIDRRLERLRQIRGWFEAWL